MEILFYRQKCDIPDSIKEFDLAISARRTTPSDIKTSSTIFVCLYD